QHANGDLLPSAAATGCGEAIETHRRPPTMTSREQFLTSDDLGATEPTRTLSNWIRCVGRRIVTWADTCADYYAAAAMYQQLSALSDAELARRGLSRATLARYARTACDREP